MTTRIPLETFIQLDEGLAQRLLPAWRKHALPLAIKLGKAVEEDRITEAQELIDQFDMTVVLRSGLKDVRTFGMMALLFGATRLSEPNETVFKGRRSPKVLDESLRHFALTMDALSFQLRQALRRGLKRWQDQQVADRDRTFKAERIRDFVSFAKSTAGAAGQQSLKIGASLHMSRLSAWGYTEEARFRGLTHYRISEQLDGRTCPVCSEMHGKVFPVANARDRLDTVLRVDDPAELRSINPFPRQDAASVAQLKAMNASERIRQGWDTPPYHPNCRGLLVGLQKGDKTPSVEEIPKVVTPGRQNLPPDINPEVAALVEERLETGESPIGIITALGLSAEVFKRIEDALKAPVD